ncbi:hypothetical protein HMPREF3232_00286 [Fannyhessea vaginae]|nr:hypothetical protein HMPREF3232_00286 [Fannyhessea vaginae]
MSSNELFCHTLILPQSFIPSWLQVLFFNEIARESSNLMIDINCVALNVPCYISFVFF